LAILCDCPQSQPLRRSLYDLGSLEREFQVPILLLPLFGIFAPATDAKCREALGHPGGSWVARDPDVGAPGYGIVGRIGSSRLRHGADIRSLAFSPNGGLIVAGDCQRTVIVWETGTGRVVRRWDLPARLCGPVGFSADGCRVVWCLGDGSIRSHDIRSGAEVRVIRQGSPKAVQAVLSSGQITALDRHGHLYIWDELTGRASKILPPNESPVRSDCGRYEASVTSPSALRCLDRMTGKSQEFSPGDDRLHRMGCVQFSADARYVFATAFGGRVLCFDRTTGELRNRYGPLPASPDCLALSPDGQCLAAAVHNRIHLLDVATGKERFASPGSFARPPALRIGPDGSSIVLSGGYPAPREEVWDLATARRRSTSPIPRIAWEERMSPFPLVAPNGRVRVSFGGVGRGFSQFDTSVLSFSDDEGKPLWSVKKGLPGREGYAFSADGAWVAVVEENGLAVYDAATGRMVRELPNVGPIARREWAHGVAFTPDRFAVLTAHASGVVYWPIGNASPPREMRVASGETLDGHEALLAVSPDGRVAVVGTDRFELIVIELATLSERFRVSTRQRGLAWSTLFTLDGRRLIVVNGDGTVTIHDLANAASPLAESGAELATIWPELVTEDAAAAFRAMRHLAATPQLTLAWLRHHLMLATAEEQIARWIRDLDAPRYSTRELAQRELARLGHAARPGLVAASRTELSPECQRRVETLLEGTRGPDLTPDGIRTSRAVEVVERLRSPEAVTLLREWAAGPAGATRTECARAAVARCGASR